MRPNRLYVDEKTNRPYYIIDKKRKYIKVPKGVSMKQIQKVNIKNIIGEPVKRRIKRRKKPIKPQFGKKLVTSMVPGVLPSSGGLPTYVFQEKKPVQSIEDVVKAFVKKEPKLLKDAEIAPTPKIKDKIPFEELSEGASIPIRRPGIEKIESIDLTPPIPRSPIPRSPRLRDDAFEADRERRFRENEEKTLGDMQRRLRINKKEKKEKEGKGKGDEDGDGLYNDEIEVIAQKRLKNFVPVIASDETSELLQYVKRGDKHFAFVINTDPSGSPGRHWTCVYIDNRDSYPSIEFFDPLAEGTPPNDIINISRKIAKKMNPEKMFKFKYNIIRRQSTKTNNCGHHCIKFLEDRYNGIPFCEASGYDDFIEHNKDKLKGADGSVMGEGDIKKMMPVYNSYI